MSGAELLKRVAEVRSLLQALPSAANDLELPATETALILAHKAIDLCMTDLYRRFG